MPRVFQSATLIRLPRVPLVYVSSTYRGLLRLRGKYVFLFPALSINAIEKRTNLFRHAVELFRSHAAF